MYSNLGLAQADAKAIYGSAAGVNELCTWNRKRVTTETLDKATLKRERPEMYERFLMPSKPTTAHVLAKDLNYRL